MLRGTVRWRAVEGVRIRPEGTALLTGTWSFSLRAVTVLSLLLGAAGVQAQRIPTFGASVEFPAGNSPYGIGAVDLDRDGHVDLIVANSQNASLGSPTISILRGDGMGAFAAPKIVTVSDDPRSVAVADLDRDGDADILLAHWGNHPTDVVSVLLGNGTAETFAVSTIPVGSDPSSLVVGDFDIDGAIDWAVALGSGVEAHFGNGTGSFSESSAMSIGDDDATALAAGRLDADAIPDFVIGTYQGRIFPIIGKPVRKFTHLQDGIFIGGRITSIVTADFTSDGAVDVAVANQDGNAVTILVNDGTGQLSIGQTISLSGTTIGLGVADFNHDSFADLAVAQSRGNSVTVLAGDGHGAFLAHPPIPVGAGPLFLAIADFNRDRAPDIATGNTVGKTVSVILNGEPGPPPLCLTDRTICSDGISCTEDRCDETVGCVNAPSPNGARCVTRTGCMMPGTVCQGGQCQGADGCPDVEVLDGIASGISVRISIPATAVGIYRVKVFGSQSTAVVPAPVGRGNRKVTKVVNVKLSAGQSRTLQLKLNGFGKKLLKQQETLRATVGVQVRQKKQVVTDATFSHTVTR